MVPIISDEVYEHVVSCKIKTKLAKMRDNLFIYLINLPTKAGDNTIEHLSPLRVSPNPTQPTQ